MSNNFLWGLAEPLGYKSTYTGGVRVPGDQNFNESYRILEVVYIHAEVFQCVSFYGYYYALKAFLTFWRSFGRSELHKGEYFFLTPSPEHEPQIFLPKLCWK